MPTTTVKHRILAENAHQIWQWFQERGGIAVWKSVDMSNPGRSWTTPIRDAEGKPMPKQDWRMEGTPSLTITDPAEVVVDVPKEIKRFRVAIKTGAQGMLLKCSDASSRRIRRECRKGGRGIVVRIRLRDPGSRHLRAGRKQAVAGIHPGFPLSCM